MGSISSEEWTRSSAQIPEKQTAIIFGPKGEYVISHDVGVIALEPDTVLVKVTAVSLNPVDTKMLGDFAVPDAILGLDCAGNVVAVGSEVTKFKVGDRVCGSADCMNKCRPLGGAFAQYISFIADLALKTTDDMSFETASTVGTPIASVTVGLFHSLGIPPKWLETPTDDPFTVLVYGGSSATGTMIIQFLRICGLRVVATCSPRNFDFVKSYGAEAVFDYNSPTCAADIKACTKNRLGHIVDCITTAETMKLCYAAMGRCGGKYTALEPFPESGATRKVIKPDWILATQIMGRKIWWPAPYGREADLDMRFKLGGPMYGTVERLFQEGRIKTHPTRVVEGGFEAVLDGVGMLRRGEVSGVKLVYPIE